ncbi:MAG: glycosyltransferase family 4 protein [Firmicutes bacterium]|nr:glycosyltransferase family 4 protein [Bacillota bacterium]
MRILVVSQYYYPESFAITNICEGLVRLGHRVQVLTSKPQYGFGQVPKDYQKITDEIVSGVNIHRVRTFARKRSILSILLNYFTFYRAAMHDIDQLPGKYDVVMSVSLSPLMSIAPAIRYAKKHHIPHLLYAVDVWPESLLVNPKIKPNRFIYQMLKRWSLALYRQVSQIVVGSPSYVPHFKQLVDEDRVLPKALVQPAMIETFGNEKIDYGDGFHLVYAGNVGTIQHLDLLIHAWKRTGPQDHFHIIGDGSQLSALMDIVKLSPFQHRIHFYAHQTPENLGKFLMDADAFYVGLHTPGIVGKTIPHKLIQYLPFGHPILGYIQGDGLAILKALKPSFILQAKFANLPQLIKKIKSLDADKKAWIRSQHQQYYLEHYAVDKACERLVNHFNELIQRHKH